MDANQTSPATPVASPTSSTSVPVSPPAPGPAAAAEEGEKAVGRTRSPSLVPGVKILKKQSTLGSGKNKEGVKFADSKGGKIAVSVYVENLYYLTSTRYQASLEANAASQQQQPGGCCTIS